MAIRQRFSCPCVDGQQHVYVGELACTRLTWPGWLLGQIGRLIGAPLPLACGGRLPVTVVVTESARRGGQIWTRLYGQERGLPQVIQSAKCMNGPTGCEELVGAGIGMELVVSVERRALVFRSRRFFLRIGRRAVCLPRWLTPGDIEVTHREERAGEFSFLLTVTHPLAGRIVEQLAFFRDGPYP